jgi:hypothetical protein
MSERLGHLPDGIYSLYLAAHTPAAQTDTVKGLQPVHDFVTIELLNERVAYLEAKLQQVDSGVQEDAAREAVRKVLDMFPFNATKQGFSINGGPHLTADGDTEFYSVKKVHEFLTAIKTTLDAAGATEAKP